MPEDAMNEAVQCHLASQQLFLGDKQRLVRISSSHSLYNHFGVQPGGNGQGHATAPCQHWTAEKCRPRIVPSLRSAWHSRRVRGLLESQT